MLQMLNIAFAEIDLLLLMLIRVSGIVFVSSIFGRQNVPGTMKLGLSFFVAYVLMLAYPPQAVEYGNMWGFAFKCIGELLFGIILGYVTTAFFAATLVAGQIIDMQSGFSMVNVIDPQSNAQVPITGNLLNIIMTLCFVAANGHRTVIFMIANTLERVPIGMVSIDRQITASVVEMFIHAFALGINIAMPAVAAGITVEVALGVMIRTVPQMNMYVVGIPIKIIIGFIMLVMMIPVFVAITSGIFDSMYLYMDALLEGLVPTG